MVRSPTEDMDRTTVNLVMSDDKRKKYFAADGRETELGNKALKGAGIGAAGGGAVGGGNTFSRTRSF